MRNISMVGIKIVAGAIAATVAAAVVIDSGKAELKKALRAK